MCRISILPAPFGLADIFTNRLLVLRIDRNPRILLIRAEHFLSVELMLQDIQIRLRRIVSRT